MTKVSLTLVEQSSHLPNLIPSDGLSRASTHSVCFRVCAFIKLIHSLLCLHDRQQLSIDLGFNGARSTTSDDSWVDDP